MAVTLAKVTQMRPDTNLEQALSEYDAILSDEQRLQFHSEGLPDAKAAIHLTKIIDEQCNENRRRCMGPRIITFLESIQNISAVVDTFVSSHPEKAALVWGGVKVTLLAANNISSYFDQLSNFLMKLGNEWPLINAFGSLYPSERLQKALYDYSAAVVRLCKDVMENLRKPSYVQWSNAFLSFKTQFGSHEKNIKGLAQTVRKEASLASRQAQRIEYESQARERSEQSQSRQVITNLTRSFHRREKENQTWHLDINRRRLEKEKLEALDALSTYDHQTAYRRLCRERVPGTSEWILEDPNFCEWMKGSSQRLWFTVGTGKSMISAYVVSHLIGSRSRDDVVSYFFCRFDEQESLRSDTVIGSIARQLVSDLPPEGFRKFGRENSSRTAINELVRDALSLEKRYFIVLDGLDECEEREAAKVIEIFQDLFVSSNLPLKIFLSSRPLVSGWLSKKFSAQQRIKLDSGINESKVAADVQKFISATLIDWLEGDEPQLEIGDPTVVAAVRDTLVEKSDGMFEWVRLQLQTIREMGSDDQILSALSDLPRDLPETFSRILVRCAKEDREDLGRRIFRLVATAKRPLTLEELREAISIRPLQKTWEPSSLINNTRKAIGYCGNLLFIDEEKETVHFTHSSVKQYLLSTIPGEALRTYSINPEEADMEIGTICVTYLNLPIFDTRLARKGKDIHPANLTSAVVRRSLPSKRVANQMALLILRRERKSDKSIDDILKKTEEQSNNHDGQRHLEQYSLLPYARRFWLDHTKQGFDPDSIRLWRLWCTLIEEADQRDTLSNVPWTTNELDTCASIVMEWVAEQDQCSMAQFILKSSKNINTAAIRTLAEGAASRNHLRLLILCLDSTYMSQSILNSSLEIAAQGGFSEMVNVLLDTKADVDDNIVENRSRIALQAAAGGGHLDIIERLLQAKADVNAKPADSGGRTALQAAAGGGHLDMVERLLQAKADVNAEPAYSGGRTALQAAAEGGYLDIVERLLQAKADVNAEPADNDGRTALQVAAGGGHMDVGERLLQAKADHNAKPADSSGRTALQAAAEGGHLDIVERLLQAKADVNAKPAYSGGRTALQAAAGGGHLDIVERLLQAKANVNTELAYRSGRTALQAAAGSGHLEIIERLLQAKADVNAKPAKYDGRTGLQAAAGGGHLDIVERLLQAKADVNAEPAYSGGRTALQVAAEGGHLDIVERLLQAKADVNAEPAHWSGRTALQAAAGGGHWDTVERLLQVKAEVNAKPADHDGRTALQAAAGGGHLDIVERLLQAKADVNAKAVDNDGRTALQAAAGGGHLDIVERLLQAKADVNARPANWGGRTTLQAAAGGGHLDIVERLLQAKADVNAEPAHWSGRTALQAAAGGGHWDTVERLLQVKAEVNAEPADSGGRTALQAAAGGGHLGIVERLLQAKADVNAKAVDDDGRTALQAAAGGGHLDIVERLLQAKADVNTELAYRSGRTALQAAAGSGHLEIIERLLQAKADVNAKPAKYDGRTALQAAAEGGHLDIVERLLQAKADVNAKPAYSGGRTALQAAAEGGHLDIVERLRAARAQT